MPAEGRQQAFACSAAIVHAKIIQANCRTVVAGLMEQILDIRRYDVQRTMVQGQIALRRPQH